MLIFPLHIPDTEERIFAFDYHLLFSAYPNRPIYNSDKFAVVFAYLAIDGHTSYNYVYISYLPYKYKPME